jgi:hypothetical protein
MKTAIDIVKNIFLSKLKEDSQFAEQKVYSVLWEKLTVDLLHFEEDVKPIYASIYSLELADPEKLISKLPVLYSNFLKELAETYVLGESSIATEYLLKTKNQKFNKEVVFFKTMQQAIKSVERKRIKTDLPNSYDRLVFELSETDVENVIKKKSREDLRAKFKHWDLELEEVKEPVYSYHYKDQESTVAQSKKEIKVISLSWMKYAVAASIIIAAGIFYFKTTDLIIVPEGNTVVKTDDKKETSAPHNNIPTNDAIVLAEIETSSRSITVLQPLSLGYAPGTEHPKVTVYFKDATKRILSLEKLFEKNKVTNSVDSKITDVYKADLAELKRQKNKYIFDGNILTIFSKNTSEQYAVLLTEDQQYFLKKGDRFYNVKLSSSPLPLNLVSDAKTIEILEKISFENE